MTLQTDYPVKVICDVLDLARSTFYHTSAVAEEGDLRAALRDLVAWDTGVRERKVLKRESWNLVLTPVALNSGKTYPYGFGWSVDSINGRRVEAHGGSWQGFQTFIGRFPDDELSVIVLANLASFGVGELILLYRRPRFGVLVTGASGMLGRRRSASSGTETPGMSLRRRMNSRRSGSSGSRPAGG